MTAPAPTAGLAKLLQKAQDQQAERSTNPTLKLTASIMSGDLWAGGAGWNGPLPRPNKDNTNETLNLSAEIERTFVSRNLARDVVRRHKNAIAGKEPLWSVTLRQAGKVNSKEQAQIDEYTAALTDWWEDSGAWGSAGKALETALSLGKSTLRLYIHESATVENANGQREIPAGLSLSEAARRVSIHAPSWDAAGTVKDLDGHVKGAYFTRAEDNTQTRWELHERAGDKTRIYPYANKNEDGFTDYPTSGLLIYEIELEPMITNSIRRLLKMANKTLTMGSRNVDLGGFTERTILNAQMPGEFKEVGGIKKFIPDAYHVGAGTTNFLSGQKLFAEDPDYPGQFKPTGSFANPSITYKDPSAFTVFANGFEKAREMILDEANQLHVLIAVDASASGVSRQQAVNDFVTSLEATRIALEQLIKWLLTTVLELALYFTNRTNELAPYRVRVQGRLSAVQRTPEEVRQALELHQKGLISEEEALQAAGVEDIEATRAARLSEGITPALALVIADKPLPQYIIMRAFQKAFPALDITDEDIGLQRAIDLMDTQSELGANDLSLDPDPNNG